MADRRRRKKHCPRIHISAALVPSAAFVAVPSVPVPSIVKCIEDAPLMGALLNSAAISRMFGSPQPESDKDLECTTSMLDYKEMTDNGYLTIPFGELTPEKMPASFIDERHFAEGAKMFDENSNGVDEIDKNSSCLFSPVFEETLLARNCYPLKEIEEEIVPLVKEPQTRMFESPKQRTSEEIYETEPVNKKPDQGREQQLKEEIVNLRDIVHRLNIELSKYQAKYCSAQVLDQCQNIEGLPTQGPIPSWLISTKYLSPLVMEYGEQIDRLETNVATYKKEFEKASKHCSELITENENLHEKLGKLTSGSGYILERSVMDQRIDLLTAENLILLEQIKSEKTKNRDIFYTHSTEIQELKDQLHLKNERCNKLEQELGQEIKLNQELKISLERLESENQNKIALTEYENSLDTLKRRHNKLIEEHEKTKNELQAKLQLCNEEKETFLNVQDQCKDKIERMHGTIKTLKSKTREYEITNRKLLEVLKVTQNMEYLSQEQLQRFRLNEEVVQKILEKHNKSTEQRKQMKNKLKVYKKKLSDELLGRKDAINNLRQEFEIQIQQLCATLKHKEHLLQISEVDRLQMEDDMETLWQAAQSENQIMRQILKRISCQCQPKSLLSDDC